MLKAFFNKKDTNQKNKAAPTPIRYQRLSDDDCLKAINAVLSSPSNNDIKTYFSPLLSQLKEIESIWELCHYQPILDEVITCFKRISATLRELEELKAKYYITHSEEKLLNLFPSYSKERRRNINLIHDRCDEIKLHWSRLYFTEQMINFYKHVQIITAYINKTINPNAEVPFFVTNFASSINHQSWLEIVAKSKDMVMDEGAYLYRSCESEAFAAFINKLSNLSQQSHFWKSYFNRGSVDNNLRAMADLICSNDLVNQETFNTLTAPAFYLYFQDLCAEGKPANLKALSENLDLCLQINQARVLHIVKEEKLINGKSREGHSFSYISNRLASNENPLRAQSSVSSQKSESTTVIKSNNTQSRPVAIQSNHSSFFKFAVGVAAVAAATVVYKSLFRPK